jgi:hypothetical protein
VVPAVQNRSLVEIDHDVQRELRTITRSPIANEPDPNPATDLVLTDRVRKGHLPLMVDGPVVLLNLDLGTVVPFCDKLAVRLAQDLSLKLTDPARTPVNCVVGPDVMRCVQLERPPTGSRSPVPVDWVIVDFDATKGTPRITSAIVGSNRQNLSLMKDQRQQIATCP